MNASSASFRSSLNSPAALGIRIVPAPESYDNSLGMSLYSKARPLLSGALGRFTWEIDRRFVPNATVSKVPTVHVPKDSFSGLPTKYPANVLCSTERPDTLPCTVISSGTLNL